MFGFFFKKNLCDVWDNIFYVVIVNFFSLIALSVTAFAMKVEFFSKIPEIYRYPVLFVTFIAGCILICTIAFAGSENAVAAANFNSPRYGNFFKRILPSFKDGAFSGLFIGLVATVACEPSFLLQDVETFRRKQWKPSLACLHGYDFLVYPYDCFCLPVVFTCQGNHEKQLPEMPQEMLHHFF